MYFIWPFLDYTHGFYYYYWNSVSFKVLCVYLFDYILGLIFYYLLALIYHLEGMFFFKVLKYYIRSMARFFFITTSLNLVAPADSAYSFTYTHTYTYRHTHIYIYIYIYIYQSYIYIYIYGEIKRGRKKRLVSKYVEVSLPIWKEIVGIIYIYIYNIYPWTKK